MNDTGGHAAMRALFAAHDQALLEAATKNFVAMIVAALGIYSPEQMAQLERHYTQLFDGILGGWGTHWVAGEVFPQARALYHQGREEH
jgi:hypothetical protein